MKIIRIYLYEGSDDHVLALANDDQDEYQIQSASKEFQRLDGIYARREESNADYTKSVEAVENGLSLFLETQGICLPETMSISLYGIDDN